MKWYSEKRKECKENGNLINIDSSPYVEFYGDTFPADILVCLRYKSVCGSDVCKLERINE